MTLKKALRPRTRPRNQNNGVLEYGAKRELRPVFAWLMTLKKRSGLLSEKRVIRVPADRASPKATGRIRLMLKPDASSNQYVVARIDCSCDLKQPTLRIFFLGG
jgi:hypothetical protein